MSARPDTWMPLYIGDYLADTGHLSAAEHGAYLLLIMAYWRGGKPLPANQEQLRRTARMSAKEWQASGETILAFFTLTGEGYWHKRIEDEMTSWSEKKQKRSKAGAIGAAKRWQTHGNRMPEPLAKECPSPSPLPGSEEPSGSSPPVSPQIFDMAEWPPTPEAIAYAAEHNLDPDRVAQDIQDWAKNAPKSRRRKRDPLAFWQGWCRKDADRQPSRPPMKSNGRAAGDAAVKEVFGELEHALRSDVARSGPGESGPAPLLPAPEHH